MPLPRSPRQPRTSSIREGAASSRNYKSVSSEGTKSRGKSQSPRNGEASRYGDKRLKGSTASGLSSEQREDKGTRTRSAAPSARHGEKTSTGRDYQGSGSQRRSSGDVRASTAGSRNAARDYGNGNSRGRSTSEVELPKRKGWGSLASKGAAAVLNNDPGRKSSREEERMERPRPEAEIYELRQDDDSKQVVKPKGRVRRSDDAQFVLSPEAIREIEERIGRKGSERLIRYLRDAGRAYEAERWGDVRKALRPLLADVPDAPIVQELNGMTLYRLGKWAAACKELELSHKQTMSYDLYPAMMDCRRALKQGKKVEELWKELREISPSPEVLAEGRIVYASELGDQGRIEDAIRLLEKAPRPKRDVKPHHLRSWYVLADLYERSGDVGKARIWFERIAQKDPELADVLDRLETLD